jgi:hypothetical protein
MDVRIIWELLKFQVLKPCLIPVKSESLVIGASIFEMFLEDSSM